MRRLIKIGVFLVALAIAGGAIAVAWLATSESAVAWLAARAVAAAGGALEITEPRGSLAGTVRMARLRYEDEDFRITAQDVALEPALIAALARRLELKTLAARELEIVIKPTPSSTPDTLALPLAVGIGRATVGRLVVRSGPDELVFDSVTLAYEGSAMRHAIRDVKVGSPLGALEGTLAFGAARPFPASGTATLAREDAKLPVALQATLSGSLELLEVALGGKAAGSGAGGTQRTSGPCCRPGTGMNSRPIFAFEKAPTVTSAGRMAAATVNSVSISTSPLASDNFAACAARSQWPFPMMPWLSGSAPVRSVT